MEKYRFCIRFFTGQPRRFRDDFTIQKALNVLPGPHALTTRVKRCAPWPHGFSTVWPGPHIGRLFVKPCGWRGTHLLRGSFLVAFRPPKMSKIQCTVMHFTRFRAPGGQFPPSVHDDLAGPGKRVSLCFSMIPTRLEFSELW